MSDLDHCIRGCVSPCSCPACQECAQPIHPPVPRPATDGMLCAPCSKAIKAYLRDIPDLYATLDPYHAPPTEETERHKRTKLSGSPSLVRLDVVALMDRRTVPEVVGRDADGNPLMDGSLMDVVGVLCSWAVMLAEEQRITTPVRTLLDATDLLTRWHDVVCASPWVDEMYTDLRDVARALRRAHGDTGPRPVGKCISVYERGGHMVACQRMLYAPASGATIKCSGCGRRYDGMALIRVKMQAAREA